MTTTSYNGTIESNAIRFYATQLEGNDILFPDTMHASDQLIHVVIFFTRVTSNYSDLSTPTAILQVRDSLSDIMRY